MDKYFKKFFTTFIPKPDVIKYRDYGVYLVLTIIIIISLMCIFVNSYFFYQRSGLNAYIKIGLACAGLLSCAYLLNRQAQYDATFIICIIVVTIFSYSGVFFYGQSFGHQYYFLGLIFAIQLNPRFSILETIFISLVIVAIYLYLYVKSINYPIAEDVSSIALYIFNALMTFSALTVAVSNYRLYTDELIERLKLYADTDMLTKLMNRRSMLVEIQRLSTMTDRYEQHNALILIDVDHFKKVNDTYGHNAGDAILRQFAVILKKHLRETDYIARWGGEEFLILMPLTSEENALMIAEKIRSLIEETQFELGQRSLFLTITGGVAEIQPNDSANDSLSRVDQLLYHGKKNGRNLIVSRDLLAQKNPSKIARKNN